MNMTLRHENEVTSEKAQLVKPASNNGFLTVTGTIKRGKNKGECFDVHLKMNRDRLAKIEKEVNELINDSTKTKRKYEPMDKICRSIV